jgi:AraC family transcriptional regulator of adaptative response/methylated-DNA-[protein]-cysteine methyltransferase
MRNPATAEDRHQGTIEEVCRLIEESEEIPTLDELASAVGLSSFHLQRTFKSVTGVTPKGYSEALRTDQVQKKLLNGSSVTEAIYTAGYNSSSRFYENSTKILGMKPANFRRKASGETIRFAVGPCSLGNILVAGTAKGICAILIHDDPEYLVQNLQERFSGAEFIGGDYEFEGWVAEVLRVVDDPSQKCSLPLDIRGTAFQRKVWEALQTIPSGKTVTYTDIATKIGNPRSVRAVAQACGTNNIAVIIPCHRVIRTDGSLSGYRWGIERKLQLLDREAD